MTDPRSAKVVGRPPAAATPWIPRPESQLVQLAWAEGAGLLPRVVLFGAAGIGKTQIASAIFREKTGSMDFGLWVTAQSVRQLIDSYAAAADSLGVAADSNTTSQSQEDRARSFLERLDRAPGLDCLVVLDDLSIPDDQMAPWWPPLGPTVRTLVTMRRPSSSMFSDQWVALEVSALTRQDSAEFLRSAAPGRTSGQDQVVIDALIEGSDGHPLALQQIAALLRSGGGSPSEVLEQLVNPARSAQSLLAVGRTVEAEKQLKALVQAQEQALGPNDPSTLASRANLATVIAKVGRLQEALAYAEDLLIDQMRVLGPDHPTTLTTRANLAQLHGQAGDTQYAIAQLHDLLTDQMRVLGPDHPTTGATRGELAYWLGQSGDSSGALAVLAEAKPVVGPEGKSATVDRRGQSTP